ncbi:MAG TPA: LemA family protein, partial [Rhizomicrobium sp.]|nr:LemA family protein [Rhizomicrobium sp.]
NGLARRKNVVAEASSGIEAQLKRRADLIPNLVETVKGSALLNMFRRRDGSLAFASGKVLSRMDSAEAIADLASHCLRLLTAVSTLVFNYQPDDASLQ